MPDLSMRRPIAFVLGTRPEIIKLAPLVRLFEFRRARYFIVHTGQHYSYEMDRIFFHDLGLSNPRYQLRVRSEGNRHADHTGRMMEAVEKILMKERPRVVLVQGDTNSVLAGSLAASKLPEIKIGHVEAGLRSYDRSMPEEINRILSDHVSDLLFAPTSGAKEILLGEGVEKKKIFVTGNTIVDSVFQNLKIASRRPAPATGRAIPKQYFLMTLHRQENVDKKETLRSILEGLSRILKEFRIPILFSVHPRTQNKIKDFGLKLPEGVRSLKPLGFLDFLELERSAKMILTDSGGLQEEACILGVPCLTLRTTTERPETVRAGANVIAGHEPAQILKSACKMFGKKNSWKNPFGDGRASQRIAEVIQRLAPL